MGGGGGDYGALYNNEMLHTFLFWILIAINYLLFKFLGGGRWGGNNYKAFFIPFRIRAQKYFF